LTLGLEIVYSPEDIIAYWRVYMASPAEAPLASSTDALHPTVDALHEKLKALAVTYGLRPGERVNEVALARQFNVSRTPLREALNRLMVEGFLSRTAKKGFVRRRLDAKEIYGLYEFRRALETAVIHLAGARAKDEELAELLEFVDSSKDEGDEDSKALRFLKLDEEFHERLAALTGNVEIVAQLKSLNARIHFVRWIDMQHRRRSTQNEHRAIVVALQARGDGAKAEKLLSAHISRRLGQIVEVVRQVCRDLPLKLRRPVTTLYPYSHSHLSSLTRPIAKEEA
jgi:DNA-binding GntR family transcriptional regulator